MIIATATERDIPALICLEEAGFPVSQRWSERSWRSELGADGGLVMVARSAEDVVVAAAAFRCVGAVAELFRIVVLPQARRSGVARMLEQAGEQWASALGAQRMMLEVNQDNEAALGLYAQVGFTPIAVRADYYGPGTKAVVMERQLEESKRVCDE